MTEAEVLRQINRRMDKQYFAFDRAQPFKVSGWQWSRAAAWGRLRVSIL